MKGLKIYCGALMAVLMTGCGGGGSNAGSSTMYGFVTPKVNSEQIYSRTTVDNSNNTINQSGRNTVTAVNADGSYILVNDDPTNDSIIVNGTTYTTIPESITNNKSGQEISYTQMPTTGPSITCMDSPHGAGPSYPLTAGQSWTSNYSVTCGSAQPISYTQTGSVVGAESVTVPAGTFSAIKVQSTLTWADPDGITQTESVETWRDTNTSIVVKRVINYKYSATPSTNSYPVTTTVELQSQS